MPTRRLKVTVAYTGTGFVGWQVQARGRTVQGEFEAALATMHGHPVRVHAAGRTDTGVHADGQVVGFDSDIDSISPERFCIALNSWLPPDVRAVMSREVDDRFHARYSATRRVYRYYWSAEAVVHPAAAGRVTRLKHRPSVANLNRLAGPLLGRHDFSTFTPPTEPSDNRVREVTHAAFFPRGTFLVFEIAANAFLWRMVRSVAGTLIELDKLGAGPIEVARRLAACDHAAAGPSAPSGGLALHRVEYPEEYMP